MRSDLKYGQYLRVKNDRGSIEEWYIYPKWSISFIQECVNVASSYKEAHSVLTSHGLRITRLADPDGFLV